MLKLGTKIGEFKEVEKTLIEATEKLIGGRLRYSMRHPVGSLSSFFSEKRPFLGLSDQALVDVALNATDRWLEIADSLKTPEERFMAVFGECGVLSVRKELRWYGNNTAVGCCEDADSAVFRGILARGP